MIINSKGRITATMAMRLGYSCSTTPDLCANAQTNYDLWHACKEVNARDVEALRQAA
jgi:plasmid maintenance system antidote protein VapI